MQCFHPTLTDLALCFGRLKYEECVLVTLKKEQVNSVSNFKGYCLRFIFTCRPGVSSKVNLRKSHFLLEALCEQNR